MNEKQEGIPHSKTLFNIQIGNLVCKGKSIYRVVQILNFEKIIGKKVPGEKEEELHMRDLSCCPQDSGEVAIGTMEDIESIPEEKWKIAEKRFNAIKPLLAKYVVSESEVQICAEKSGVGIATIYRWLRTYKKSGLLSSLTPQKKGARKGSSRLSDEQENVIEEVIQNHYLTPQRPTQQSTITEIKRICLERGIRSPSPGAIRLRLSRISERIQLRSRGYKEKARNKFAPVPGHFPNADYPLAVVQIDHTPADIILVDDEHRKTIGRPYITLAMDVCTRIITGYYLSLEPPSVTSIAMCLALSILPKDNWLAHQGISNEWPVWGIPETIHVDNGADFRSETFRKACIQHGINLEYRPVKRPNFGGHIERVLGTLLREMHSLPGTTFSSVKDRDEYDSEKHAVMTFSELQKWIVTWICSVYHKKKHASLGMSPLDRWHLGILGDNENPGRGLPPIPGDPHSFLLDFLPSYKRTIQANGVSIDNWVYYGSELRPWINSIDPETGEKRRFIFRKDPRDISVVWFFDPDMKKYFSIPFADQRLPSLSEWESKKIKKDLKKEGITAPTEHDMLRGYTELKKQEASSKEKTKKARRRAQAHKEHQKKVSPAAPPETEAEPTTTSEDLGGFIPKDQVEVFGEIS